MDIWAEQARLTKTLGAWAAGSVVAGTALAVVGRAADRPFLIGFGRQHVLWGAIDGAIAAGGEFARRRRLGWSLDPANPILVEEETAKLRRVLSINTTLDAAYVVVGLGVMAGSRRLGRGRPDRARMFVGDGAAIVVQGGFLLVLDATSARRLA